MENVLKYLEFISKYNKSISNRMIDNNKKITATNTKRSNKCYFRGQSNKSWNLIPGIFRKESIKYDETKLIKSSLKFKYSHIDFEDIDLNIILQKIFELQHYHMPTRLLDWSDNPLVALFFAACENHDKDGAIFLLSNTQINGNENIAQIKEFNFRLKLKLSIIDNEAKIFEILNNEYNFIKDRFDNPYIEDDNNTQQEIEIAVQNNNQMSNVYKFAKEIMKIEKAKMKSYIKDLTNSLHNFVTDNGCVFSLNNEREMLLEIKKRLSFIYQLNEPSIIKYRENDRGKNQSSLFTMHFGKVINNKIIIPYDIFDLNKRLEKEDELSHFHTHILNGSSLFVTKLLLKKELKGKIIHELRKYFGIHDAFIYPDDKKKSFEYLYQEFNYKAQEEFDK